ncbi:MAG TPA: radical SAM protein [Bacteroidales bacterium]|nr:radical SAM protein [Bacteroidales bacterium]HOL98639.1 radical SAM protein [Bacteroidales bacterium]HUM33084.1 radical SAM protein [Bacteroidales bacterium]
MNFENLKYDIIFIIPRYQPSEGFIWKAIEYRFHSPGVLSLAGFLKFHGCKTAIFDCNLEQISEESFEIEFDKRFGNSDALFFGFSCATQTVNSAYRLSEKIKKKFPHSKIIFGGAHPTALPEDVLKHRHIDYVAVGEGEITLLKLLQSTNPTEIKGLAYRKEDNIIINPPGDRIKNMDSLPLPDYSIIPIHKSKPLIGTYKRLPATIMVTARGCPGRCTFCSRVTGNYLSVMSPERMLEEVKILHYKYGFNQIIFYDDTFISDKKRIEKFCDLLIENKINISWTCSSRVDRVYPELLKKMKKAGCYQIMFGIESFNEQVLRNINKKTKPEDIFYAIRETKKAGIEARAAIMLGNPGDTVEILNENIKLLKKLNPDMIQVTITTAIPGSQMFKEAHNKGKILTYNWDKYEGNYQIVEHETLDFKTLQKYYRKTYLKFYLRPSFILRSIFKINSLTKIKVLMIGLFSIFPIIFKNIFSGNSKK